MSDRSPLKLRALLTTGATSAAEILQRAPMPGVKKAAAALSATGGYVDEALFRQIFGLELRALTWLAKSGLLTSAVDHYSAHDELRVVKVGVGTSLITLARTYLAAQVNSMPQHLWACRSLVNFVERYGQTESTDAVFSEAARTLIQVNDWEPIDRVLTQIACDAERYPAAPMFIAEEAAHIARHEVVDVLAKRLGVVKLPANLKIHLDLILSERHLWSGDFQIAEKLARGVLARTSEREVVARAHLNVGLVFFFKGLWEAALRELTSIDRSSLTPRTAGWMQMIEGTIRGIRGEGTRVLQHAIHLLQGSRDEVGLAIGWNNLGELRWRTGDLRSALVCLNTALELCRSRGDRATELDSIRNLVNTYLRQGDAAVPALAQHVALLRALLREVPDKTEHMQAWNTLAMVALFQGDQTAAAAYIKKASSYTKNNVEYHIYTLVNASFLKMMAGRAREGRQYLRDAIALIVEGKNYVALRQLIADLDMLIARSKGSGLLSLKSELKRIPIRIRRQAERITV